MRKKKLPSKQRLELVKADFIIGMTVEEAKAKHGKYISALQLRQISKENNTPKLIAEYAAIPCQDGEYRSIADLGANAKGSSKITGKHVYAAIAAWVSREDAPDSNTWETLNSTEYKRKMFRAVTGYCRRHVPGWFLARDEQAKVTDPEGQAMILSDNTSAVDYLKAKVNLIERIFPEESRGFKTNDPFVTKLEQAGKMDAIMTQIGGLQVSLADDAPDLLAKLLDSIKASAEAQAKVDADPARVEYAPKCAVSVATC